MRGKRRRKIRSWGKRLWLKGSAPKSINYFDDRDASGCPDWRHIVSYLGKRWPLLSVVHGAAIVVAMFAGTASAQTQLSCARTPQELANLSCNGASIAPCIPTGTLEEIQQIQRIYAAQAAAWQA